MRSLTQCCLAFLMLASACSSPTSVPEETTEDALSVGLGTFCDWPLIAPDRKTVILDDCNAPGGPRVARLDVSTGQITTVATHRGHLATALGDAFVYLEEPDATHFVAHRVPFAGGPHQTITFPGARPEQDKVFSDIVLARDGMTFVAWRKVPNLANTRHEELGELLVGRFDAPSVAHVVAVPEPEVFYPNLSSFNTFAAHLDRSGKKLLLVEDQYWRALGARFRQGPTYLVDLDDAAPTPPVLRRITSWKDTAKVIDFDGSTAYLSYATAQVEHVVRVDLDADTATDLGMTPVLSAQVERVGDELVYVQRAPDPVLWHRFASAIIAKNVSTGAERTLRTFAPPWNKDVYFNVSRSKTWIAITETSSANGDSRSVRLPFAGGTAEPYDGKAGAMSIAGAVEYEYTWNTNREVAENDLVGSKIGAVDALLDLETAQKIPLPAGFPGHSRPRVRQATIDGRVLAVMGGTLNGVYDFDRPFVRDAATGAYRPITFPSILQAGDAAIRPLADGRWLAVEPVPPARSADRPTAFRAALAD
jgi:hypothetical protein